VNNQDVDRLISLYLFDRAGMTAEQIAYLSEWITQDSSHVRHYLECVRFHSLVRQYHGQNDVSRKAALEESSVDLDPAMAEGDLVQLLLMETSSPPLEVDRPQADPGLRPADLPSKTFAREKASRFWLSVAVSSAAAVLLVAVGVMVLPPRPSPVATLRDSLDSQWLNTNKGYAKGYRFLSDGQPVRLAKGLASLSFDHGAELVLEGPSEIKVFGINHVALSYGKVCARVPASARGFRVDAPHYGVVDLGTEFGMEVGVDGTANLLMYRGKASFVSGEAPVAEAGVLITEGQARSVRMDGRIVESEIETDRFVRAFDPQSGLLWRGQPIDLADVVGGGNGFGSGQPQAGVHIFSGLIVPMTFGMPRPGPLGYVQAQEGSFIDGVFVPGRDGPLTQISSAGTVWPGCPKTSGQVPAGPCNAGYVGAGQNQLVLNGVRYGTTRHPALLLHSDIGITFNLAEIRRFSQGLHGGLRPSHLRAVAGLSDDVLTRWADQLRKPPVADLWVLVDGQERLKTQLAGGADPIQIDIALEPNASFLTIALTEGADRSLTLDSAVLGNPVIVLSAD
jgi:hypothetical protein